LARALFGVRIRGIDCDFRLTLDSFLSATRGWIRECLSHR